MNKMHFSKTLTLTINKPFNIFSSNSMFSFLQTYKVFLEFFNFITNFK